MFAFKKLLTPFLLPPGVFVLLLLLLGFWSLRRENRKTAATFITIGSLFWVFSTGLMANWMLGRLESGLVLPKKTDADVIIMLGSGVNAKSPDLSGIGAPGPHSMERMVMAARLSRQWELPIIVSGGKVFEHGGSIAQITRRFLEDLGIPSSMIITEERSRDTYENALYSAEACEQHGFKRPVLVTSASHMKRARLSFDRVGLAVIAYPCALTTWPDKRVTFWHALPNAGAMEAISSAMHEAIGILYYRWRY